jgi:hypothetical protein
MTRLEFAECMAYLAAGSGKALSAESAEVYFDLLGDLPIDLLRLACKKVLIEHRYATFPTVAAIRDAASPVSLEATPGEAWEAAKKVAARYDHEIQGPYLVVRQGHTKEYPSQFARLTDGLPLAIVRAIEIIGVESLRTGKDEVVRAQFLKVFSDLLERARRGDLLPAPVKEEVRALAVATQAKAIGVIPEE